MDCRSLEEHAFIKQSIMHGCRADCRSFDEERETLLLASKLSSADAFLRLKRGGTELEIAMSFRSTPKTLLELQLVPEEAAAAIGGETLSLNLLSGSSSSGPCWSKWPAGFMPFPLERIKEMLEEYNIGLLIELSVLSDDGNHHDLLFEGLRIIFSKISIPNIHNLSEDIAISMELPTVQSYAVFGQVLVLDPSSQEEAAADCVMHVFRDKDSIIEVRTEGDILSENLMNILSRLSSQ